MPGFTEEFRNNVLDYLRAERLTHEGRPEIILWFSVPTANVERKRFEGWETAPWYACVHELTIAPSSAIPVSGPSAPSMRGYRYIGARYLGTPAGGKKSEDFWDLQASLLAPSFGTKLKAEWHGPTSAPVTVRNDEAEERFTEEPESFAVTVTPAEIGGAEEKGGEEPGAKIWAGLPSPLEVGFVFTHERAPGVSGGLGMLL